ncbi:hypothetical protein [Sorangium sp. So ce131]|uniref:hypothetical protein n=1 Tax=Sorangium sp. So ce131 TaxID=3133282 RepID=UPI003F62C35B
MPSERLRPPHEFRAPELRAPELGHRNVSTTMGYMHLSPSAKRSAIALLDGPPAGAVRGGNLEMVGVLVGKVSSSA